MSLTFEWDDAKRESNLLKHGVDFTRVPMLFDGRAVMSAPSRRGDEERFATTGEIDGRFYTAIWTWRGDTIRIISARRARREEEDRHRALHGEGN